MKDRMDSEYVRRPDAKGHLKVMETRQIARQLVDFWKEWKTEPLPPPDHVSEE
jgi:hypothetical protein